MPKARKSDEGIQLTTLRLEKSLHERIIERAKKNRRSINDEILIMLDKWVDTAIETYSFSSEAINTIHEEVSGP